VSYELADEALTLEGDDLQRAILVELVELNHRLERAESGMLRFFKGRNAKLMLGVLAAKTGARW
jgi:hypothetical protein